MEIGPPQRLSEVIGDRRLFVTRWWGFRPARWVAVCFSSEKVVDDWIAACPEGGFVLPGDSGKAREGKGRQGKGRQGTAMVSESATNQRSQAPSASG
jgi:hypothetical protein